VKIGSLRAGIPIFPTLVNQNKKAAEYIRRSMPHVGGCRNENVSLENVLWPRLCALGTGLHLHVLHELVGEEAQRGR